MNRHDSTLATVTPEIVIARDGQRRDGDTCSFCRRFNFPMTSLIGKWRIEQVGA